MARGKRKKKVPGIVVGMNLKKSKRELRLMGHDADAGAPEPEPPKQELLDIRVENAIRTSTYLLEQLSDEVTNLRRRNEILNAQVRVMDGMFALLSARPGGGEGVTLGKDVVYEARQQRANALRLCEDLHHARNGKQAAERHAQRGH